MKFPFPDEIKLEIKTKNKLLKKYKSKKRQGEDYKTELDNYRASIKSLKVKFQYLTINYGRISQTKLDKAKYHQDYGGTRLKKT